MTIEEFLEARLAEDEAWARDTEAAQDRDASFGRITVRRWLPSFPPGKPYRDPWPLPGEPRLVLREVAAKRAILSASGDTYAGPPWEDSDIESGAADAWNGRQAAYREVLISLASTYCDHPDFSEEWHPDTPADPGLETL